MSHVDEGLIHAWLEDQLPPDEAARVEQLVTTDAAWGAAAAEARGLIAASSRVLGALDSAPSAGATPITARTGRTEPTGRTGDSWARKYWLRAAAAIVLVVGISGIWFRGEEVSLDVPQEQAKARSAGGAPPPVAESQTPPAQLTSPRVSAPLPQASAVDARSGAGRQQARGRAEQSPPVASAPPPPPATPPAAAVVRDEATGARAVTAAKDSGADRRVAGDIAGVGAGRGGGRGGRGAAAFEAASLSAQRSEAPRSDVMKSLATVVDSVQRGCWVPLDTFPPPSRQANESARPDVMVLRFVPPVVTDLTIPAPALARANAPLQTASVSALRAAPTNARMQHTTARAKDDSTLVAEWFNPDGRRTQLTFRVRGDTLRGTTNTITGDIVIAGSVFVAVRAQCTQ